MICRCTTRASASAGQVGRSEAGEARRVGITSDRRVVVVVVLVVTK